MFILPNKKKYNYEQSILKRSASRANPLLQQNRSFINILEIRKSIVPSSPCRSSLNNPTQIEEQQFGNRMNFKRFHTDINSELPSKIIHLPKISSQKKHLRIVGELANSFKKQPRTPKSVKHSVGIKRMEVDSNGIPIKRRLRKKKTGILTEEYLSAWKIRTKTFQFNEMA